jgi:hypothetical protein
VSCSGKPSLPLSSLLFILPTELDDCLGRHLRSGQGGGLSFRSSIWLDNPTGSCESFRPLVDNNQPLPHHQAPQTIHWTWFRRQYPDCMHEGLSQVTLGALDSENPTKLKVNSRFSSKSSREVSVWLSQCGFHPLRKLGYRLKTSVNVNLGRAHF